MTAARDDARARARIETELDTTLVVVAGAGTGKTTALVGRILQLVRSGRASLREIAAITFTEAAAAELRQRIRDAVAREAAHRPGDPLLGAARHETDEAAICTLHAFARRILVEHSVAAGIPPGFDVMDETAERADFEARFERFADALLADPGAEEALVRGFSVGLVRTDLAEMAWALHRHWDRLEDGGLDALERLRPPPTRWPAAEPAPVMAALDDALALGPLCTDDGDRLKEHLDATLAPARARLATCDDAQSTLQFLSGVPGFRFSRGRQANWGNRADEVRAACAVAEDARLALLDRTRHAVLGELGARLARFVLAAANERRAEGRLALHDLLVHTRRLLRHDGAAREALRRRYRRLLIDEFQDTDPIQVELAARLATAVDGSADLGASVPGGLFVVGDPKQSIYRFRRADIESFSRVGKEIGDAIVLATNFRSVPGILDFVNAVFAELFGAPPEPGQAEHHELQGLRDALPLLPPPRRAPAGGGRTRGGRGDRAPSPRDGAAPRAVPHGGGEQLTLADLLAEGWSTDPSNTSGEAAPAGRETGGSSAAPLALAGEATPGGQRRPARRETGGPPPVVVLGGPHRGTAGEIRRASARDVAEAVAAVHDEGWAVATAGPPPRPGAEPRAQPEEGPAIGAARWRDVAVLLPTRTGLAALEEALEEARVPYRLEGVAMLWGSQEVRDVLAVLHAVDDPADALAVLAALRSPALGCGDDDLVTWRQAGGRWDPRAEPPPGAQAHPVAGAMAVLAAMHERRWWHEPSAMVSLVLSELRCFELCLAYHRPRDHWHRLRWLLDQARLFDETVGGTLRSFLRWAELQAEDDRHSGGVGPPDPDDDAVRVMTVHGSKGLEFPVAVLAGFEREAGAGQRPSPVLWADDGTPELRARRDLKSGGYDVASERDRRLDALEQHRLLYVAMTRARDHLVLALHHKELREGSTAVPTEAALVYEICERRTDLWRRLPPMSAGMTSAGLTRAGARDVASGVPVGAGDDATRTDGATEQALSALSAAFGLSAGDTGKEMSEKGRDDERVAAWRERLQAFEHGRRSLLETGRRAPVTTATAVAAHEAARLGVAPATKLPSWTAAPDPGSPDATASPWRDAEVSLQVGRAVHAALASLDLGTGTDAAGRGPVEVARGRAAAQGVADHGDAVVAMVTAALRSPTVAATAQRHRRHWRELFVAVPLEGAGVLEGYVDLVQEEDGGLVVVDYKTDRVDGSGAVAAAAARYAPQLASYAFALESSTGMPVRRCVLVFVGGGDPVEHVLEGPALDAARSAAMDAARTLVSG